MILQDFLNRYIPPSAQEGFLAQEAHLVTRLTEELVEAEASILAQKALDYLGISTANTPHVTNVAPEDLPPAVPVWASAPAQDNHDGSVA